MNVAIDRYMGAAQRVEDMQDRAMGRPKSVVETVPVTFRITKNLADEAREIAALMSTVDLAASTTDAYRAAIVRGFQAIRAEKKAKAKR